MPQAQTVGADRNFGLGELNAWVKENEMTLGPIIGIGDGGDATAGQFDVLGELVREKWAVVALKVGEMPKIAAVAERQK